MATYGLPDRVLIKEEGPREGFQGEGHIALEDRLLLIDALGGAGLASVDCVSFVDPKRVPQMADADELARRIVRRPRVRYTGIWLNGKGFDRALASGLDLQPNVVASASSAFSTENNGCTGSELIQRQGAMIERYRAAKRCRARSTSATPWERPTRIMSALLNTVQSRWPVRWPSVHGLRNRSSGIRCLASP